MFTANQYRAKATEYRRLLDGQRSPAQTSEFRNLVQSYTMLADNAEWLALNVDKLVRASDCHERGCRGPIGHHQFLATDQRCSRQ